MTITAASRYDIAGLVAVRKALEAGAAMVPVVFLDGSPRACFLQADLPTIYRKLIYSV